MEEELQKLVERAKADPKFFHNLVFNPDAVSKELSDRRLKSAVFGINPDRFINSIIGSGGVEWCDGTCGASSCIDTCGARSCGRTCDDSCGTTCSHSCGDTTKSIGNIGDVINPALRRQLNR